ncbi:Mov34/MPN/PAD-1 family protein [Chitinispirillum alkaliphilum]|nr:Mov34/MPN/PAD-1 family protein [Chitinispirillum alkaliphilum]
MLELKKEVYNNLVEHARRDLPIEACGYLGEKAGIVEQGFEMTNVDNSPEHFSFEPAEQFNVVKLMRKSGLKLRAVYHSHPVTPARPSQEDIRLAFDPELSYVIVSLAGDNEVVKSFIIKEGTVREEEIRIV